jgi:glutamate synthase domain-containing protein 2
MMLVSKYLPLPRQVGEEFWDIERIEHIRRLATTGKPYKIRVDRRDSLRILDRIVFKELPENLDPKEDVDASTYTEISGIPMSSPIYLGDMSYGALSGIPNVAIAMAADAMGILAGTGEGVLHPDVAKYRRIFV